MESKDLIVKKIPKWEPPEENDARILGMPNIYYALQGKGLQPRTIVGSTEWTKMRKLCYYNARWKCEACGEYQGPGKTQAHEVFSTDWKNGQAVFIRLICLCEQCVDEETEVLTSTGWKKIPEVTTNDKVACWDKDGSIRFDHPTNTVVSYKDNAVKITRGDTELFFSEDHRLPLKVASKQSQSYGQIKDVLAGDYKPSHYYNWMSGGNTVGDGKLTAEERIYIAIEADGHLSWDKEDVGTRSSEDGERQRTYNSRYASQDYRYTYTISLYKDRKIERLKKLLEASNLKYKIVKSNSDSYCVFNIWTNVECKHFSKCFSQDMPSEKAMEFIEELVFWDGAHTGGATVWYTNKPEEADFVQGIAAQCNIATNVTVVNRIGNLRKGEWKTPYERLSYAVRFHSIYNEYCARELKPKKVKWGKNMYCITVPTSYFIARRKGFVFVTGNCHLGVIHSGRALTMYQRGDYRMPKSKLLEGVEHGFKVVSEWNKAHEDQEPILLYSTFLSYLEDPTLKEDMERLFTKYGVKLYGNYKPAEWSKWRMIYNKKIYPTPYKDKDDYVRQMQVQHATQNKKVEDVAGRRQKAVNELEKALKGE